MSDALMQLVSVNKACPKCKSWEVHVGYRIGRPYVLRRCEDCGWRWEDVPEEAAE